MIEFRISNFEFRIDRLSSLSPGAWMDEEKFEIRNSKFEICGGGGR